MTDAKENWNKCDQCGRFIPYVDFESGAAARVLVTPESAFTRETFETLCPHHMPAAWKEAQ